MVRTGLVWFGLVWSNMVNGYCLDLIAWKIWKSDFENQLSYGQYMEIWFGLILVWLGLVWFGLIWSDMVNGCCLDVIPCKIWKSYFEKQLSYGQYT